MKEKLTLVSIIAFVIILFSVQGVRAQFSEPFISLLVGSGPSNGEILTTDGTNSTWVTPASLGLGGGGGSGSGTISTTTNPTIGDLAFWDSLSTLASIATSSLNIASSDLVNDAGFITSSSLSPYFLLSAWYATTTDALTEGSNNLYFTNARVNDVINASSTIWNNNTEASLEAHLTDVTNVFTNNDGALNDDDLTNNSIEELSDVASISNVLGDLLYWTGSVWDRLATSSLNIATADLIGTIDISDQTNLAGDSEIVLTDDTLSIASSIARDSELHDAVTLGGSLDYITLAGQVITRNAIDLTTDTTGTLGETSGGTGQSTFTTGDILYSDASNSLAKLGIGSENQVLKVVSGIPAWSTDATGGGSGGGTWSTTTSQVAGRLINYSNNDTDIVSIGSNSTTTSEFWFDPNVDQAHLGTIISGVWNGTAIDISDYTNLTVSATGLELQDDTLALTSGYGIPLTASTTNWNTFYDTPSTRITAGTGLSWSGNTLNAEVETADLHDAVTLSGTPDYITLSGQDIVRGTIDIGDDTNLAVDAPITLTGDTLGFNFGLSNTWTAHNIFSSLFATNASSTNATTTNLHIVGLGGGGGDLKIDANGRVFEGTDNSGSSFAYPFPSNATTTILDFANGITAGASTFDATVTGTTFQGTGGTNALEFTGGNAYFLRTSDAYSTYFYQEPAYTELVSSAIAVIGNTTHSGEVTVDANQKLNIGAGTEIEFSSTTISEHPTLGFFDFQTKGGDYTLGRIKAPVGSSKEATLALLIDVNEDNSGTDEEFVDIYNEKYGDSWQWGLRQAYSGAGVAKPFALGHWAIGGSKDAGNKLIILPSGTVGIAQATSTLDNTVMLHVASSTASTLASFDTTPGSSILDVTTEGINVTGTTTTTNLTVTGAVSILGEYFTNFTNYIESIVNGMNAVLTGSWDFGGATFLEIPNGTAPTANDVGEIAHDTTDNQLILDDFVVARATNRIWSVTVASTSPAFIGGGLLKIPTEIDGYTMTAIRCSVQGGTSKVVAVEDESTSSTEDITCATSVTSDDGTITNATVTAGEEMYIDFGATTGAVDYVSISVFGQYTRE